jgi:hydrogen peroxide-dependent heme synthase
VTEAPMQVDEATHAALDGWAVLHLFFSVGRDVDTDAVASAMKACEADGHQAFAVEVLGHKADFAVVGLGPSFRRLRQLQSELVGAGLVLEWSYVSLTEVSEYASGAPDEMKRARLRPVLPPEGLEVFCFYPMSKRRGEQENWYRLEYEDRLRQMIGHGTTGRNFRGRVLQLVTGSTGLDDWEWGVTLFCRSFNDLKECVYTMRFDEASARFAEFGPFLTGTIGDATKILAGLTNRV